MAQAQLDTVEWLTDALATAFGNNKLQGVENNPPNKPKAAWAEPVPVIEVSSRPRQETKQWIEQWKLLQKRESLAAAGVPMQLHGIACYAA